MPKRPDAKRKVFISHISEESDIAQWLKGQLTRDFLGTLEVFVSSDRLTIEAGRRWLEEVDKALKTADMQVLLCSQESVGRGSTSRPARYGSAGFPWCRSAIRD